MKAKNILFVILVIFISGSIVYYMFAEYTDMVESKDAYQQVYRHSEYSSSTTSPAEEDIKEAIVNEVMKEFRKESGRQTFTDDELLKLHRRYSN